MRISFSTAALYPRPSVEALRLLAGAGYEEAELMPQCREETTPRFARQLVKAGTRVSSIHFPLVFFSVFYNPYPGMTQEARELADDLAEAARIMGSDILVIHALPKLDKVKQGLFEGPILDNFRYMADALAVVGTKLAVENNPSTRGDTPEGLIESVRVIDHPNTGPMVDTTESWEAEIDPTHFILAVKPIHLHLSDHAGEEKHIPAGEGEGDWKEILSAVRETGYGGIYVLEPAYRHYLDDPVRKLERDREFIGSMGR